MFGFIKQGPWTIALYCLFTTILIRPLLYVQLYVNNKIVNVDEVQGRSERVWRQWRTLLVEKSQAAKEMPETVMHTQDSSRTRTLTSVQ